MAGVSGHVYRRAERGGRWYAKYRLASGKQTEKVLGPNWKGRGRPPAGHFTRKTAKDELVRILDRAQEEAPYKGDTGATFADAAAEYLRYVEDVKRIDPATSRDYRGVIEGYLLAEFGEQPLRRRDGRPDRHL
jgi:hypothetical protein